MINENTLLVRLDPTQKAEEESDDVMMSLFLDFLLTSVVKEPDSLVVYTSEMSEEAKELLAEVKLDED